VQPSYHKTQGTGKKSSFYRNFMSSRHTRDIEGVICCFHVNQNFMLTSCVNRFPAVSLTAVEQMDTSHQCLPVTPSAGTQITRITQFVCLSTLSRPEGRLYLQLLARTGCLADAGPPGSLPAIAMDTYLRSKDTSFNPYK
jgi:hypothetical protein